MSAPLSLTVGVVVPAWRRYRAPEVTVLSLRRQTVVGDQFVVVARPQGAA